MITNTIKLVKRYNKVRLCAEIKGKMRNNF